jgi:hypothetical protein
MLALLGGATIVDVSRLRVKFTLIKIPVKVTGRESEGLTVEANIFPEYVKPRRKN